MDVKFHNLHRNPPPHQGRKGNFAAGDLTNADDDDRVVSMVYHIVAIHDGETLYELSERDIQPQPRWLDHAKLTGYAESNQRIMEHCSTMLLAEEGDGNFDWAAYLPNNWGRVGNKCNRSPGRHLVRSLVFQMASLLAKRVASNLLRVRTIASSSRFFSTKCYEYVQHDSKDECILKYDDKNASSLVRGVVNDAFSPHASPTENLARLLNFADWRVKFIHGTSHHRWSVVEDDKALCIFRDMSEGFNQDVKELVPNKESMFGIDEKNVEESGPNKESMTGIDEKNVKESVPIPKEEVVSEPYWINVKESVLPTRNVFPVIDIMRGNEYTPDEYYYHVMKDANEVNQFVDSLDVIGDPDTRGPYGGYAVEIFLEDSFYDIYGIQRDLTGEHRKIVIPKKKSMGIETIGGNIIFFCEKKFYKPTPWRPT
ncbi:hypothetical protein Tco_1361124 [Tanacetum coccineum]